MTDPEKRIAAFLLTAKTQKFVPANTKIAHIKKSTAQMQKHLQATSHSINKMNSSKGNPKLKALRIAKAKALQNFLRAGIILNEARIKNLTHPD